MTKKKNEVRIKFTPADKCRHMVFMPGYLGMCDPGQVITITPETYEKEIRGRTDWELQTVADWNNEQGGQS